MLDVVKHVLYDRLGIDLPAGFRVGVRQEHEVTVTHQAAVPLQVARRGRVPVQAVRHVEGAFTEVEDFAHEEIGFTRLVMVVDGAHLFLVVVAHAVRQCVPVVLETGRQRTEGCRDGRVDALQE